MSAEFCGTDLEASGVMSHWPQDSAARSPRWRWPEGDKYCCFVMLNFGFVVIKYHWFRSPLSHLLTWPTFPSGFFRVSQCSWQPPPLLSLPSSSWKSFAPLHLPPSSRSLAAMAFTHIFEHQPRKAIWLQIMQVRIIVILESILTLDDHFAGPDQCLPPYALFKRNTWR